MFQRLLVKWLTDKITIKTTWTGTRAPSAPRARSSLPYYCHMRYRCRTSRSTCKLRVWIYWLRRTCLGATPSITQGCTKVRSTETCSSSQNFPIPKRRELCSWSTIAWVTHCLASKRRSHHLGKVKVRALRVEITTPFQTQTASWQWTPRREAPDPTVSAYSLWKM